MICNSGKFLLFEQLWMQVSFNGIFIIGFLSILQFNWIIAVSYLILFPFIGILYFIMHLWLCPRCPHIKDHSACVQLPPFLTQRIYKKGVNGPLSRSRKAGFFIVLYGILVVPVYWVVQTNYLWIPFWFLGTMHYGAYFVWFCKRCLNVACPQNLNFKLKYANKPSC
jgi:hypothetical protein